MEIKNLIVSENDSLKVGLEVLNSNGLGTLFAVGDDGCMKGIVTDGDIRRSLLAGVSLQSPISVIMNKNFISLSFQSENEEILQTLSDRIRIIPLVDELGRLVDYASNKRIRRIPVASPLLDGNELAYVTECIKTNWISSQGKFVRKFEEMFRDYHRGYNALAVSNGTVALHLALEALNIGHGDEVLVPNLTFAASINAILYTGAVPVLVDIDPETWTIDVRAAEKRITAKCKAIMPVHLYGHPCEMAGIAELARKYNLKVVEDCAEALGSFYDGQAVGTFGDAATFSFFGNKIITTGEGGMVLFKDLQVADRAAMLRDHGMQKDRRYWHQEVGYNYRMTNLQAAVGVAQFERLEKFVAAKRRIADAYTRTLKDFSFLTLPAQKGLVVNSFWLYTLLVHPTAPFKPSEFQSFLASRGIETRPVFFCMHEMPPYAAFGNAEDLLVSKYVSTNGMSLPSAVSLSEAELDYICKTIEEFVQVLHS